MTSDPIRYIDRTRRYYAALGYEPYDWAQFEDVPFRPVERPLSLLRIGLVTTAAPFDPLKGDQGSGAPYNAGAKFYTVYSGHTETDPDLRISHVGIDRDHTTGEDQNAYFPLPALRRSVDRGLIGTVAPRFHGLPTNRSKRITMDVDCVELVDRVIQDQADAVLLVPNCPVCHQSCALAARALEAAGVATVVMGTALDIVEHVGVPRFLFSDFPLGNAAGRPHDIQSQDETLEMALHLLTESKRPRTTRHSPLAWSSDPSWKQDYCNVDRLSRGELARRRQQHEAIRAEARSVRTR